METLIPFALLCFTSFFTLTNPLGTMPVFLTMTQGMTDKERRSIVSRATLVSFITLMVFVFAGQFLFKFFGISTNGFRIAGGVIIFKIGFDMFTFEKGFCIADDILGTVIKGAELHNGISPVIEKINNRGKIPVASNSSSLPC